MGELGVGVVCRRGIVYVGDFFFGGGHLCVCGWFVRRVCLGCFCLFVGREGGMGDGIGNGYQCGVGSCDICC